MIIPIRCMGCGKLIADKWRWYQTRVNQLRPQGPGSEGNGAQTIFMDGTEAVKTPEGQALNELGLTRICCRKHFLTHRDLMDKI
jgi:DNA-directed RNA polymerase subunit N (RpoN/RPB10)